MSSKTASYHGWMCRNEKVRFPHTSLVLDSTRYQLLAVEWMKSRESLPVGEDISSPISKLHSSPSHCVRVTLPISGLLHVSGLNNTTDHSELWAHLFGLPIQCPERVRDQTLLSESVCFYSDDEISGLLTDVDSGLQIDRLKSFW
jgi:hypothetical protein